MDRTRPTGARGEQLAAEHLLRLGYRILARNVRTRAGEIDLVALDRSTLVFAEVKTRRLQPRRATDTQALAEPLSGLRPAQRARLRRLAAAWLVTERPAGTCARLIRFDAIGVVLDRRGRLLALEHLRGAW